jgi:predicted nuclease of predicted toxin-antitoxin system
MDFLNLGIKEDTVPQITTIRQTDQPTNKVSLIIYNELKAHLACTAFANFIIVMQRC